jgi:hypothetical protein
LNFVVNPKITVAGVEAYKGFEKMARALRAAATLARALGQNTLFSVRSRQRAGVVSAGATGFQVMPPFAVAKRFESTEVIVA